MKRSSFLKTLLGIAIAPKVLAETKYLTPVHFPEGTTRINEGKGITQFNVVYRRDIEDMIYPKVKRWTTVDWSVKNEYLQYEYRKYHQITYVDREYNGNHYCVIVRGVSTDQIHNSIEYDVKQIMSDKWRPNHIFDAIIIG